VKEKADYTLDVRGTISPFSMLKVSLVFQKMKPEEMVEIIGCDLEMQRDLLKVLPVDSCEIVCTDPGGTKSDPGRVRLKKTGSSTTAA
jgi:TusA-related sulfurtransferase